MNAEKTFTTYVCPRRRHDAMPRISSCFFFDDETRDATEGTVDGCDLFLKDFEMASERQLWFGVVVVVDDGRVM